MSTKHAILGVLMHCPSHGYRIKKIFAPFFAKSGLNDGRLYPVLTKLEQSGLVRKETVRQKKSPNKNIYHITDSGREEFLRWLKGEEDEFDPIKYDFFQQYSFLMKCNFFEHLDRDERIEKLERQVAAANEKIAEYERIRDEMRERGLSEYKIKIVDFGIEAQRHKIEWVEQLLNDENGNGSPNRASKRRAATARSKAKS